MQLLKGFKGFTCSVTKCRNNAMKNSNVWIGDCNGTRTYNRLVRIRTLSHLAKPSPVAVT